MKKFTILFLASLAAIGILGPVGAGGLFLACGAYIYVTIKQGRRAVRAYAYLLQLDESGGDRASANYLALGLDNATITMLTNPMLARVEVVYLGRQKLLILDARVQGFIG